MATVRNIEDLKLDEITEEVLLEQAIAMGEALGVDTNQGSVYRDACDGHVTRTSDFFDDLSMVAEIISINTCTGEILDERLAEQGMARNPPEDTPATYYVEFVGASPEVGDLVSCDDHFFNTAKDGEGNWVIVSQEKGTEMNSLVPGLPVIPERDVDDMISATLGSLAIPAVDTEDDDSARARFLEKIAGPAENGNAAQIKSWCEGITGVGRARILKLWDGPGTVKAVITADDGTAPSESIVNQVQQTIDPGASGLGEGLVTIGCFFTAVASVEVPIDISVEVTKTANGSFAAIKDDIEAALKAYLKGLALAAADETTVRVNSIGSLIANVSGVVDYENLLVNGGTDNVPISVYQVPVAGEVIVDGRI